jgi:hypothetical protein
LLSANYSDSLPGLELFSFTPPMNTKQLTLLALLLGTTSSISRAQAYSAQAVDPSSLFALFHCKDNAQPGVTICRAVLPASLDTKRSKAGDHVFIKMALTVGPGEQPIAMLDAAIIDVQPAARGRRSLLRLRINSAIGKDRHELPVQVNVIALASQSAVTERWDVPVIIVDGFPRTPEDEQRLPGERKFSEDQRHTSPLDTIPNGPVLHTIVCDKKVKKAAGTTCMDLLDAHGVYGYKGVILEPRDDASSADSVLSSEKNIRLPAGTVMVLEVKNIHAPRKS